MSQWKKPSGNYDLVTIKWQEEHIISKMNNEAKLVHWWKILAMKCYI